MKIFYMNVGSIREYYRMDDSVDIRYPTYDYEFLHFTTGIWKKPSKAFGGRVFSDPVHIPITYNEWVIENI